MNRLLILFFVALICSFALGLSGNTAIAQNDVTFQVNMSVKMLEGTFQPDSGDIVRVAGSFNNWGESTDTLADLDGDSIYTKTISLAGGEINFKYLKTLRGGIDWESDPNRTFFVEPVSQSVPLDYFDRDDVYNPPTTDGQVTFQVNMSIKMLEGSFQPGSGDVVQVKGSFNGWGGTDVMADVDGDSIYTVELTIPQGEINYKFFKTLRGGSDWESDPNRNYTVVEGAQTITADYFDRDNVYNPPTSDVPVVFQVNMSVKMLEGTFIPDSGDIVRVAGGFNGWGASTDTLFDGDGDSVYSKAVNIAENSNILYKFLKTPRGNLEWEDNIGGNREFTVPVGGGAIPIVYFDNDALVSVPITANINWQVDMTTMSMLGWFRPDLGDSVQVRGGFNAWGGDVMQENLFSPGAYEFTRPYSGTSYDDLPHKFFIDFDSISTSTRFAAYTDANRDDYRYDHPADRGDGNAVFNVGVGGDIQSPLRYFSSISPNGIINEGDTVQVTLMANMGPATRYTIPLDLVNDTVKVVFQQGLWLDAQIRNQGSFAREHIMTPVTPGDSVYQVTFLVIGPTHYNMMYVYRYIQPGGTVVVDQTGGLGGQYNYQSRYIQPVTGGNLAKASATSWPRYYTAPTDNWKKNSPFVSEVAPFDIVNDVIEDPMRGQPTAYKLTQNYPNPFNPSTRIRYSIPEAAKVTLKVFNVLGQQVATLVNQEQPSGNYVALFEAAKFPSGVYFYRLEAGKFLDVKKMVLMK
jgi:hypothetical protein